MRKARRLHYQQQPDYLDMKNRYKEARIKRERTGIELTRGELPQLTYRYSWGF
jgi:hypothetical protein